MFSKTLGRGLGMWNYNPFFTSCLLCIASRLSPNTANIIALPVGIGIGPLILCACLALVILPMVMSKMLFRGLLKMYGCIKWSTSLLWAFMQRRRTLFARATTTLVQDPTDIVLGLLFSWVSRLTHCVDYYVNSHTLISLMQVYFLLFSSADFVRGRYATRAPQSAECQVPGIAGSYDRSLLPNRIDIFMHVEVYWQSSSNW